MEILYIGSQNACALNENNKKEQKRKDIQRAATWRSVSQFVPLKWAAHSMRHSPQHSAQLFPQDHCHRQEHRVDDLQLEALDFVGEHFVRNLAGYK